MKKSPNAKALVFCESWFRNLSPQEEEEFRKDARQKYQVGSEIDDLWHPVYRMECMKMNEEDTPAELR
jgi:hypothetical protein